MATQIPPPLHDVPTAKQKKYDRQLRLWGANGQEALETAHILLINNGAGVTGIETLKNLVLPGIGHFSIVDTAIVSEADLGVNFFLEDASLGKSRAAETVKYLEELNPDAKGYAISEPLETWAVREKAFDPFTIVLVAAPLPPAVAKIVETHLRTLKIPTFYFHSVGFYSKFSLFLPSAYPIVDTHPDPTSTTDLRLLNPWPELSTFAAEKTANMDGMTEEEFAHIPYVCLLLHYLEKWKAEKGGKPPETYKEKTSFRDLVRSGSPSEENFDEACAAVIKSLNPPIPPSAVREILTAPEAHPTNFQSNPEPFWIIAHAVQQFYEEHGELPLTGAVPDMKARSDTYIQLQNIYKTKARKDFAEVLATVRLIEDSIQRKTTSIPESLVENFCKSAGTISLVRGVPPKISPGQLDFDGRASYLAQKLTDPDSLALQYVAFLAYDVSAANAGSQDNGVNMKTEAEIEREAEILTSIAHKVMDAIVKEASTEIEASEYASLKNQASSHCLELVRAGGAELHNVASLTGGLISQEVIKVITKQYVPVDNTCIFDGISSRTSVLRV